MQSNEKELNRNLLLLVSKAHSIIAEMNRLSDHIPVVFRTNTDEDRRYKYILGQTEFMEEFIENHLEILRRFYVMFESVLLYAKDITDLCEQLQKGIYISQSVEIVLNDPNLNQLFIESIQLYGVMLLLIDYRIEGFIRERILVTYYRAKGATELTNIEEICDLFRSTGFDPRLASSKLPPEYPVDYFKRRQMPTNIVKMMIERLLQEDLYMQTRYYPSPEQRSTALAQTGSVCFILLFFLPDTLRRQNSKMNEIVHRFFADNWVISYYMGNRVDLSTAWEGFNAARSELNAVLNLEEVKHVIHDKNKMMETIEQDLKKYPEDLLLDEDYVLEHTTDILTCLRNANCTIRWAMLHLRTENPNWLKAIREFGTKIKKTNVLTQLLSVASLELTVKDMYQDLLSRKQEHWDQVKKSCSQRVTNIAEYFGNSQLSPETKNEDMESYFRSIFTQVDTLDIKEPVSAGRKAAKMIQALENVKTYQTIEKKFELLQAISAVQIDLKQMVNTCNCREDTLININVVANMAYAWDTAGEYIALMQESIQKKASIIGKLRATFLKLSTMLEFPLMRIVQGNSPDQESVAEYYSTKLVGFVRSVLEVVPASIFSLMGDIVRLQTERIRDLPSRIPVENLKDYAQLEARTQLALLTHKVVAFTDGLLEMESTNMGVIQIDPEHLLKEGVRKQLVLYISMIYDATCIFQSTQQSSSSAMTSTSRVDAFKVQLAKAYRQIWGLKSSFEYIQDYIGLYGLKIWQEEIQRVVNFYVEQECNTVLKHKVHDWQSKFQSEAVPIPLFQPRDQQSATFIGRIARELISITQPPLTLYSHAKVGWVDLNSALAVLSQTSNQNTSASPSLSVQPVEVVGGQVLSLLYQALDAPLLSGLDQLLGFMIAATLTRTLSAYARLTVKETGERIEILSKIKAPSGAVPILEHLEGAKREAENTASQLLNTILPDALARVGQLQLLRVHIQNRLHAAARQESGLLLGVLDNFNSALLIDVEAHRLQPTDQPQAPAVDGSAQAAVNQQNQTKSAEEREGSPLLTSLSKYLQAVGLGDPTAQVYVASEHNPKELDFVLFMTLWIAMPRIVLEGEIAPGMDKSSKRTKDNSWILDGVAIAVGLATFLNHFHSVHTLNFIERYTQLLKVQFNKYSETLPKIVDIGKKTKSPAFPREIQVMISFARELRKYMMLPNDAMDGCIPPLFVELQ